MNKQIIATLVLWGLSYSVSLASDREVLNYNPYNVDEPSNPNVVIGIERTRSDTLESQELPSSGIKAPVESVQVGTAIKPVHQIESNTVSTEHVIADVTQPLINIAQRKLVGTPQEYLMVTKPNSRVYISKADGKVYFYAQSGSLKDNIIALLSVTNTHLPLVYEVSVQHSNPTDVWLYGDTTVDVLNALITNYKNPHPIQANTYSNRVVEIYYDRKNRQR